MMLQFLMGNKLFLSPTEFKIFSLIDNIFKLIANLKGIDRILIVKVKTKAVHNQIRKLISSLINHSFLFPILFDLWSYEYAIFLFSPSKRTLLSFPFRRQHRQYFFRSSNWILSWKICASCTYLQSKYSWPLFWKCDVNRLWNCIEVVR